MFRSEQTLKRRVCFIGAEEKRQRNQCAGARRGIGGKQSKKA